MPLTADSITGNILNQLKILDPTVSGEVGTPERKIIEAAAEFIASQQVDFSVLNQQQDISTLSGGRLDAFLSIYNFGRQNGTPSYGLVTFSRNLAATSQIVIPRGTQIQANLDSSIYPSLIFITTETVVMDIDATSVVAPAQCTISGTIGNIDANKVVGFAGLQSVTGISSVTNLQAFSGGTDLENDDAYRVRFQNGFLRNVSGTYDMFLALAVAAAGVTKANVLGPLSRYQEYMQVPGSNDANQVTPYDPAGTSYPAKRSSARSTNPYSKYTYPINYYLTDSTLDPATANFFRPNIDYVFNSPPWNGATGAVYVGSDTTPNVTYLGTLPGAAITLLEHAYISTHSRNDPNFGIYNCVDVFVNGENTATASSIEVVPTTAQKLQNTDATLWTYQHLTSVVVKNFTRKLDTRAAAVGSLIQFLYWQPVLDIPDTLQVGVDTYYRANFFNVADSTYYNQFDGVTYSFPAHYIFVEETNGSYGTLRARNGIEWFQSGVNYLDGQLAEDVGDAYTGDKIESLVGTQFTVENYQYDQNISDLQAVMEKNKQVTQDVLVHSTRERYFQPIVTLMYSFGVTQAVVNAAIVVALQSYFENQYYGTAIQLSDILQVIHNVPGVDNVRFTTPAGTTVNEVSKDGQTVIATFGADFFIQDSELASSPDNNAVVITARAQNVFGT